MSPEVTVAVVSWNTRELLRRCLRSLEGETRSGRCEVWVIDNASTDGSAEMVREQFGWAELIAAGENLGFGAAVNEVAGRSQAPWIAPANADIELTDGALDALLGAGEDPATAVVAPRLLVDDGSTQHSVHAFPTVGLALLFALGAYRLPRLGDRLCVEGRWDPDRPRAIDWAHGAFLLIRREAFDAAGGFDPEQWMYAEDVDIHWRLRRLGWRARYEPRARVRHAVSAAAIKAFGADRTRRHLLATYAWQARRRGLVVAWSCALINCAGAALRWGPVALAAALAPRRYGPLRDRLAAYARAHAAGLRGRSALDRAAARPDS